MKLLEKVRPWAGIIAVVGIGIYMIMNPGKAFEVTGRRQAIKSVLKAIWGLLAGIIIVAIGVIIGYLQIKSEPEDTSVE